MGRFPPLAPERRALIVECVRDKRMSIAATSRETGHARAVINRVLREEGVTPLSHAEATRRNHPANRDAVSAVADTAARADPDALREYTDLGPPPADPLELSLYMYRALAIAARRVMLSTELDEIRRADKLGKLSKEMAALTPRVRLWVAEQTVRREAEAIDDDPGPEYDELDTEQERFRAPAVR